MGFINIVIRKMDSAVNLSPKHKMVNCIICINYLLMYRLIILNLNSMINNYKNENNQQNYGYRSQNG